MRYSNGDIHIRPRLAAAEHGIGPGPLSPAWGHDETPPEPADPLDRLEQQLGRLRQNYLLGLRHADDFGPPLLSRDELHWLNARFGEIRAGNATLGWGRHSRAVAAWPEPVLPTHVLLGVRDVIGRIDEALGVLPHLRRQRAERAA